MRQHRDTLPFRIAKHIARPRLLIGMQDRAINRRWSNGRPGILLVRHPRKGPWFYRHFLEWLGHNFPRIRQQFELALLGDGVPAEPGRHRLLVPWLQDPIRAWSRTAHRQAMDMTARCDAQAVPIINRPDVLDNSAKSVVLDTARALGIRAANVRRVSTFVQLRQATEELGFPVIIKSDEGHGLDGLRLEDETARDSLTRRALAAIRNPVAIEFIDTRSADGLFRKYRYLAAGENGLSVHLLAASHWEVRGGTKIFNAAHCAEERDFISRPNPHAAAFDRLRRALGFDLAAFDYAEDKCGNLIVWEANPYPYISFGRDMDTLPYRAIAVHRCFAAMTWLYLSRAGIDVPDELAALVDDPSSAAAYCQSLQRPKR